MATIRPSYHSQHSTCTVSRYTVPSSAALCCKPLGVETCSDLYSYCKNASRCLNHIYARGVKGGELCGERVRDFHSSSHVEAVVMFFGGRPMKSAWSAVRHRPHLEMQYGRETRLPGPRIRRRHRSSDKEFIVEVT